jgi:hypothetical protein
MVMESQLAAADAFYVATAAAAAAAVIYHWPICPLARHAWQLDVIIIIIIPCKPYLSASAPRLTLWGGGK